MIIRAGIVINDRYQVLSELGEGGFAQVFRALDLELSREVAIKILKFGLQEADRISRFKREARLLGKLEHKHIISVYSYDLIEQNRPFLVMEFLEGKSLRSLLNEGPVLDCKIMTRIVLQICQALSYAHGAGIAHRDLSPENIFLTNSEASPQVKILDFGLSSILGDSEGKLTKTGELIGNPSYMSPEMSMGQKADKRTDIYSLGCIIYECLSGRRPFHADTALGLLFLQKNEYPSSPEFSWNDNYQEELFKSIALRCMQKEVENRFQSCEEIIELLSGDGNLSTSALKSLKPWSDRQSRKSTKRSSLLLLSVSSLLALVFLSATLFFFVGKNGKTGSTKEAANSTMLPNPVQRLDDIQKELESDPKALLSNAERSKTLKELDQLISRLKKKKGLLWAAYDIKSNVLNVMTIVANEPTRSSPISHKQLSDEWKKNLLQELELCKSANGGFYKESCVVLQSLAAAYLENKEYDAAVRYALNCLNICDKIDGAEKFPSLSPPIREVNTQFCRQESYNTLANAYLAKGMGEEAERYTKAYLSKLDDKGNLGPAEKLLLASVYHLKGERKKLSSLLAEILNDERASLQDIQSEGASEALRIHYLTADWCLRHQELDRARKIATPLKKAAVSMGNKELAQRAEAIIESSGKSRAAK